MGLVFRGFWGSQTQGAAGRSKHPKYHGRFYGLYWLKLSYFMFWQVFTIYFVKDVNLIGKNRMPAHDAIPQESGGMASCWHILMDFHKVLSFVDTAALIVNALSC
jgi:hypothetical protein